MERTLMNIYISFEILIIDFQLEQDLNFFETQIYVACFVKSLTITLSKETDKNK